MYTCVCVRRNTTVYTTLFVFVVFLYDKGGMFVFFF